MILFDFHLTKTLKISLFQWFRTVPRLPNISAVRLQYRLRNTGISLNLVDIDNINRVGLTVEILYNFELSSFCWQ